MHPYGPFEHRNPYLNVKGSQITRDPPVGGGGPDPGRSQRDPLVPAIGVDFSSHQLTCPKDLLWFPIET